jgi:RNA polymerase sigma-70 factor (ECF subfamily)
LHIRIAGPIVANGAETGERGDLVASDPHEQLTALLPRLYAFARTMLRDADAARDLVQEAATRALAARRVPDDAPAYRAWMFQIVRNAALDELRRMRRPAVEDPVPVDVWNFDEASIAKITVTQALALLAPPHREIISLIDIAGLSYGEAADLLRVPVGTIMSRIARARGALLAAIETSSLRPLKSRHG